MPYQNTELQRMLADLQIAMDSADRNNKASAWSDAFREGADMEAAKTKAAGQAAGAAAYQSAAGAGGTGGGGPSPEFAADLGGMGRARQMGNYAPQVEPPPGALGWRDQPFDYKAPPPAMPQGNAMAGMDPGLVSSVSSAGAPVAPMGPPLAPQAPGPGVSPQDAAALDAMLRQQQAGMGAGMPPATAGVPVGGAIPQLTGPAANTQIDPAAAAFLRSRGAM